MAGIFSGTASTVQTILSVIFLGSWSLTALVFTALDVANEKKTIIGPLAGISLLTFLVCRLVVALQPYPLVLRTADGTVVYQQDEKTIAHLIAHANRGSLRRALVFFLISCLWLYEIIVYGVILLVVTFLGSALAYAIYNDKFNENPGAAGYEEAASDPPLDETTTALVEFKEKTGYDPTEALKQLPPWVFIGTVAVIWINFISLGLYVLGHAVKSLARLLVTSSEVVIVRKEHVVVQAAIPSAPATIQDKQPVEMVSVKDSLVLEGWEDM